MGRIMYLPEDPTGMLDNPISYLLVAIGFIVFGTLLHRSRIRDRRSRPQLYFSKELLRRMGL